MYSTRSGLLDCEWGQASTTSVCNRLWNFHFNTNFRNCQYREINDLENKLDKVVCTTAMCCTREWMFVMDTLYLSHKQVYPPLNWGRKKIVKYWQNSMKICAVFQACLAANRNVDFFVLLNRQFCRGFILESQNIANHFRELHFYLNSLSHLDNANIK